jgi:hypothetical protein
MKFTRKNLKNLKNCKKNFNNKTKKIYGGDIDKNNIFKKILSIGYELETGSLAKFTLTSNSEDGSEDILVNTNTVAKDYEKLKANDEESEELFEVECYTTESLNKNNDQQSKKNKKSKLVLNKDSTFLVSNDMAIIPFSKYLNSFCNFTDNKTNNEDEEDEDSGELMDKNDLYTFETIKGETYKLNFDIWPKKDCGQFADVEWIMTYYNPKKGKNVILDTFINVIQNLVHHLESLEKTTGRLIMNFSDEDKEIIGKPEYRSLYHLPDTNLYYLETNLINEKLDIDDICVVPQMTFSCHIRDIIDIFKQLTKDDIKLIENYSILAEQRLKIIDDIEICIKQLFENYNKSVKKDFKIIESRNKNLVKEMKGYIFLILFKLHKYLNFYLTDEKVKKKLKTAKYLKDTLFFNSRHVNYDIYKALKELIKSYFFKHGNKKMTNSELVSIIQKLIIQQPILNKYLLNDKKNVRINAFSITNKLDKKNKSYGDPHYSLVSYFDFFEDPITETERRNDKDEFFHDWLQYEGIDVYSSTTEIQNDIVLTEVRTFARLIGSYIYSVGDAELKENMTNGICNRLRRHYEPDVGAFSVLVLKQFVKLLGK